MTYDEKLTKYGEELEKYLRGLYTLEQMTDSCKKIDAEFLAKLSAAKVAQVYKGTFEWDEMWEKLTATKGDYVCPITGECWQYMGTYRVSGVLFHQFRHRSYHGERTLANINPSERFLKANEPESIKV